LDQGSFSARVDASRPKDSLERSIVQTRNYLALRTDRRAAFGRARLAAAPAGRYGAGVKLRVEHLQHGLDVLHVFGQALRIATALHLAKMAQGAKAEASTQELLFRQLTMERKNSEDALRESEADLRLVLDSNHQDFNHLVVAQAA
jgi:hypothetical protein